MKIKDKARTENMLCVGCGNPLILPINDYHACTKCTEKIKKVIYETKMRGRDKRSRTQKHIRPMNYAIVKGIKTDDELLFM